MPKLLTLTRFGNPVLRETARRLTVDEIKSAEIQELIASMRYTSNQKEQGVALAAQQVGEAVALSVIAIKPTPNRPNLEPFESVIINPSYEGIGQTEGMWEGCMSCGGADNMVFGQADRYRSIQAKWYDEHGVSHNEELSGFVAHVFQHETDHTNGILFVDRVSDTHSYMMVDEYRKRIVNKQS